MLSIASVAAKPGSSFRYLSSEEYYTQGDSLRGEWHGKGAAAFGLGGSVSRLAFERLHAGSHPGSAETLVQRTRGKPHFPGWDFTFSAPKSVSIYWALADGPTRSKVEACQALAVRDALNTLERDILATKRGKGGAVIEPVAGIAAALYPHITSRELDPQLHTHAFVMNVALRIDGSTGTVFSKGAFESRNALGALYRASLAAHLSRQLGVSFRHTTVGFELESVPENAIKAFSKRRAQIVRELTAQGRTGGKAAAEATLKTRGRKIRVRREDLFKAWSAAAKELGLTRINASSPDRTDTIVSGAAEKPDPELVSSPHSSFTRDELLIHAEEEAVKKGWDARTLLRAALSLLTNLRAVSFLGLAKRRPVFATAETSLDVDKLTQAVLKGLERKGPAIPTEELARAVAAVERKRAVTFSEPQRQALSRVAAGTGAIQILRGLPGVGKTAVIEAAALAWKAAGLDVHIAAPTRAGSGLLAERTGATSHTTYKVLTDIGARDAAGPVTDTLVRAAKRGPARAALEAYSSRFRPSANTVLVVDSAADMSAKDLAPIVTATLNAGGRLVLVDKSHRAGDRASLAGLDRWIATSNLRERFRHADAEQRLRMFYGFDQKDDLAPKLSSPRPALSVADRGDATSLLIEHWRTSIRYASPKDSIITALDGEDLALLNERARRAHLGLWGWFANRASTGLLTKAIYFGQRVRFSSSVKGLDVKAGEFGTVMRRDHKHGPGWIAVKLDRGPVVHLHGKSWQKFLGPGYAVDPRTLAGRDLNNVFHLFRERPFAAYRLRDLTGQVSRGIRVVTSPDHRLAAEEAIRKAERTYEYASSREVSSVRREKHHGKTR